MINYEIYDLETLINLFTYTGYDCINKKWRQFVVCSWLNQISELVDWLYTIKDNNYYMIGFNNENFDYPIIHHIINHYEEYKYMTGEEIAQDIYNKAQQLINNEFNTIADKNKYIKQIDLFRIWHYNNAARSTSLKDLEICMNMPNVEEMPFSHNHWCKKGDEELILSYNKNDVEATFLFFKTTLGQTDYVLYKGKNKLKLRSDIQNQFGLLCLNYPDVKIGEELIINLYCKKTGKNKFDLKKQGGTKRNSIALKDCIPYWANFETSEFQKLKKQFENTIITNIKGEFKSSVIFHGIKIDYGTGGAHSSAEPGIYIADDNWTILDEDIGSLYPSIAIQLGLYPEHLGPEFLEIYDKDIVSVRLAEKKKPKKERNMVIMEGFKLCANGIYGKSGDETSILYDPLYTMKTTIGGQMFLSLWTEKLVKAIPEIKFIQHNTDGITYLLPRKDISKAQAVAEEMSKLTGLYIEDNFYSKFILRDVNNYLAVYENGDYKAKGDFEIDKEYHKDPSMRIVPLAVKEYFINGIKIEDTIKNHTNIFDFCLRLKTNSKSDGIFTHLVDSKIINDELNRTTRYYISNSKNSGTLSKRFNDGRITRINVGYSAIIFNKYVEKEIKDYNIDYNFYIKEAYKLKNAVSNGQLSLF